MIADATAAFERVGYDGKYYSAEMIHRSSLVSLQGEFRNIVSTAQMLQLIK